MTEAQGYLAILFGLAIALTLVAFKARILLFRLVGMLAWFGLGILAWTSPATIGIDTFPTGTQYIISLICAVMIFALWQLQMGTDIQHERLVRGKQAGYPGAETAKWTEWGRLPGNKHLTKWDKSRIEGEKYAAELHEISVRARKNRRRR